MTTPDPVTTTARAIHDRLADGSITKYDLRQYANQLAVLALDAAGPLIRAAAIAAEREQFTAMLRTRAAEMDAAGQHDGAAAMRETIDWIGDLT